jgi:acyl carrier protein
MTEIAFIKELAAVLAEDATEMNNETALNSLAGWDSMGKVATMAFLDASFGVRLPPGAIQECLQVRDLMAFVKDKLEV